MKFFFDRNWSRYIARAIAALNEPDGHRVEHLDDRFDPKTPDVEWLTKLGAEGGWAIITKDRLRRGPLEREAVRSSGLLVFIFVRQWAHCGQWPEAAGLVQWWPRIASVAASVSSGAFEVPYKPSGKGKLTQVRL